MKSVPTTVKPIEVRLYCFKITVKKQKCDSNELENVSKYKVQLNWLNEDLTIGHSATEEIGPTGGNNYTELQAATSNIFKKGLALRLIIDSDIGAVCNDFKLGPAVEDLNIDITLKCSDKIYGKLR
jgi:hypothetical protein